ncbi:MAG: hypothetical protein K6343_01055 [Caldisericaceae bacterium]
MKKNFLLIILVVTLLVLCGCHSPSSTSQNKTETLQTEQGTQTTLLTAQEAYKQLAAEAYKWSADAKAYKLVGGDSHKDAVVDFTDDGKSLSWRFWFSSGEKREIRVYSFRNGKPYFYPEASGGDPKKVNYEVSGFKDYWLIDSGKAFEIARTKGIVKPLLAHLYAKGNFVTVPREVRNAATPCNVWWEIWGKDESQVTREIYIDASSGAILYLSD